MKLPRRYRLAQRPASPYSPASAIHVVKRSDDRYDPLWYPICNRAQAIQPGADGDGELLPRETPLDGITLCKHCTKTLNP